MRKKIKQTKNLSTFQFYALFSLFSSSINHESYIVSYQTVLVFQEFLFSRQSTKRNSFSSHFRFKVGLVSFLCQFQQLFNPVHSNTVVKHNLP